MEAVKITPAFAAKLEEIRAANKTPWVIVFDNEITRVYRGRTEARTAKAESEIPGKIVKADEIEFEVIKPFTEVKAAPAPIEASPVAEPKAKVEVTHVSTVDRPCKLVYQIADEMLESHPGAKRKDVLAECVKQGIAYYTARTQYQQWLQVRKEMADREAKQAAVKK